MKVWVLIEDYEEWREPKAAFASKEKAEADRKRRMAEDTYISVSLAEVEFIQ